MKVNEKELENHSRIAAGLAKAAEVCITVSDDIPCNFIFHQPKYPKMVKFFRQHKL